MPENHKESLKYRLHAAMAAKFKRTKRAWTWVLRASAGTLGLSVVSVLITAPAASAAIDLFSVLLGATVFGLRLRAQGLYGDAEELRRAHRQLESHGIRPRDRVVFDLPGSIDALSLGVVSADRVYYESTVAPGPGRLADNLVESATYTRALAQCTWKICLAVALTGLVLVLGLLWYGTVTGTGGTGLLRLVPHISSLLVLGFAADLGVSFWRLERAATETVDRLEAIRMNENLRIEDLIPAVTDYDCALASTGAPIPDRLYAAMQDDLNARWADYRRAKAPRTELAPAAAGMTNTTGHTALAVKRPALRNLLFKMFDDDELRTFLRDLNDPELGAWVRGPAASFAAVVDALVSALERRNQVDPEFFAALEHLRPGFAAQIREVAVLWAA